MARKKKEQAEVRPEPKRVTPTDIQQKEFRLAFRGYNERDVDVFLDEVTEEVARLYAENKRLREEIETRSTMRGDTQAAVEADQIVRQAREQASRIVAEARSQAVRPDVAPATVRGRTAAAAGSRAALGRVVARERDFLQNLATLIQDHARALKEDLAVVRSPVQAESTSAERTQPVGIEPESGPTGGRGPSSGVPAEGPARSGESRSERTESEPAWSRTPDAEPPPGEPPEDPAPPQPEAQDTPDDSTRAWGSSLDSADREGSMPAKGQSSGTVFGLGPGGAVLAEDDPTGDQAGATPSFSEPPESSLPGEASNQSFERAALQEAGSRPRIDEDDQQDRSVRELFWGED